jgi:hypothetical protein
VNDALPPELAELFLEALNHAMQADPSERGPSPSLNLLRRRFAALMRDREELFKLRLKHEAHIQKNEEQLRDAHLLLQAAELEIRRLNQELACIKTSRAWQSILRLRRIASLPGRCLRRLVGK